MTTIRPAMLLAFDTSSTVCTAALFNQDGECLVRADEDIGRGHAERLVPMIGELMQGRHASRILVGVGPGSFTGIRVGIAAAYGLSIGWDCEIFGMSSLGLIAAGVEDGAEVAVAVTGGHGELFVQQFTGGTLEPVEGFVNGTPAAAAARITAGLVVGSGAQLLVDARGWGEARKSPVCAACALRLPESLRALAPRPVYARAPDARIPEAA